MLSYYRYIMLSEGNYCSVFNALHLEFLVLHGGISVATPNRILGIIVMTGYAERDLAHLRVLLTVKV